MYSRKSLTNTLASILFVVAVPTYTPSRQESSIAYSRTLDSTAFWNRLIEHIFVVAIFSWLSAGFLARKDFRVDLTEAHLMEVVEKLVLSFSLDTASGVEELFWSFRMK